MTIPYMRFSVFDSRRFEIKSYNWRVLSLVASISLLPAWIGCSDDTDVDSGGAKDVGQDVKVNKDVGQDVKVNKDVGVDVKVAKDVGSKLPNNWGLYDMAGNAEEWCHDRYVGNLGTAPVVDPVTTTGTVGVLRGGTTDYAPQLLRAASRLSASLNGPFYNRYTGFRCVRSLP